MIHSKPGLSSQHTFEQKIRERHQEVKSVKHRPSTPKLSEQPSSNFSIIALLIFLLFHFKVWDSFLGRNKETRLK